MPNKIGSGETEFTKGNVAELRDWLIKRRNDCLGPRNLDSEGAIYFSHIIAYMAVSSKEIFDQ